MSDKRALTTRQPYASLIMAGIKDVENRSWPVPSTLPQWMTCLGCYAEAEPDEVAADPECPRPCACDNGYTVEPGAGILDSRHVWEWVPSAEVEGATRVGPFPFRLWIHAGKTPVPYHQAKAAWDSLQPLTGEDCLMAESVCGFLLGSVLVTGCHWFDDDLDDDGVPSWRRTLCSEWAEPDAYHWTLADPQPLPEPIPMRGHQRLWTLPVRRGLVTA